MTSKLFDIADLLTSPEAIESYWGLVVADQMADEIERARGHIARAKILWSLSCAGPWDMPE